MSDESSCVSDTTEPRAPTSCAASNNVSIAYAQIAREIVAIVSAARAAAGTTKTQTGPPAGCARASIAAQPDNAKPTIHSATTAYRVGWSKARVRRSIAGTLMAG